MFDKVLMETEEEPYLYDGHDFIVKETYYFKD